jgi:uncharacterized protein (DUF1800 family)
MARRFVSTRLCWAFVLVVCGFSVVASATAPVIQSASSRLRHGSAGNFDMPLPLTGGTGIECRNVSSGTTLVIMFDQPVFVGSAQISPSSAKILGAPTFSNNGMLLRVSGLKNATSYTVTLTGVMNTGDEIANPLTLSFRTLLGDVNQSGAVTAADVNTANGWVSNSPVTATTFAGDVNLTGTVNRADVTTIKQQVGNSVAGGASGGGVITAAPPVLTPNTGTPTLLVATMGPQGDGSTSLGYGSATFTLSADQSNGILYFSYANLTTPKISEHIHGPAGPTQSAGIVFDIDNPASPSPAVQPLPNGSYQWVFDTSSNAQYTPAQWANFILTGQTYINVHTTQYPSGEIRGQFTVATGAGTLASFVPPASPPTITINPPSQYDAVRFLQQSEFGGTLAEVTALSNSKASNASTAINDWLTAQFASQQPLTYTNAASSTYSYTPGTTAYPYGTTGNPGYAASQYIGTTNSSLVTYSPSAIYPVMYTRITTPQAGQTYGLDNSPDRITECWWHNVVAGTDQLRQRIATAYSEIFVVSMVEGTVDSNPPGLATYYDMLADDAFVNFRQLLYDITLHPIMGEYLNMRANNYVNATTSVNENYAREIMQLFTIGLYMLQPDGTLSLDGTGQPIPTYPQTTITSIAGVYTGWNLNNSSVAIPVDPNPTENVSSPFYSSYQKPMLVNTATQHSNLYKQLLSYTGAALWGGGNTTNGTTVVSIPAFTSTMTATQANLELNFVLDNIFNHPNVGPFICKQLIQRLVTSNPSNAYVYRIAQVFDNDQYNGNNPTNPLTNQPSAPVGVRGNMQAVIKAILTDYEARSPALQSYQFNGKTREPLFRIANILRPMHAYSKTGFWKVGTTDNTLSQTILRSPTVFNFFSPTYTQPGPLQNAGLVAPEFDIIDETTISNAQNMIYTGIYSNGSGSGFVGDNYGGDVYLNHSSTGSGLIPLLATYGAPTMVSQVYTLMNGAPIDNTTKSTILNFISSSVSPTDVYGQVSAALHLIATSPRGASQQ